MEQTPYSFIIGLYYIMTNITRFNYNTDDGITIENLFVPSARTSNYGLKQLRANGPRIWNALPTYLKNESSSNVFMKLYNISRYD